MRTGTLYALLLVFLCDLTIERESKKIELGLENANIYGLWKRWKGGNTEKFEDMCEKKRAKE